MSDTSLIPGYAQMSDEDKLRLLNEIVSPTQTQQAIESTEQNAGLVGDAADMFQRGALQGVGGLLSLADEFTGYGAGGADYFNQWADQQLDSLSPEGAAALGKEVFTRDESGDLALGDGVNPQTLALLIAQGAGTLAPSLAGGGGAGLLARGLGAGRAASGMARAAGFGGTGGGMAQGMAGQEAKQAVMALPDEKLYQSQSFLDLWNSPFYDESVSDFENVDRVREALADEAATQVMRDPELAAVNFGSNLVMGKVFDGLFAGALGKSRLANMGLGGASEGAEEFAQEGASALSVNAAVRDIDSTVSDDNVLPQALTGAVVGFGTGAPLGVMSPVNKARDDAAAAGGDALEQELAASDAWSLANADRRTASESLNVDFDIESVNQQAADQALSEEPLGSEAWRGRPPSMRDAGEVVPDERDALITARGIDADIEVMRRLGDEEGIDLLLRIAKIRERAKTAKAAGRDEMAQRLYQNADSLYEQLLGSPKYSDWARQGEYLPREPAAQDAEPQGVVVEGAAVAEPGRVGRDVRQGIESSGVIYGAESEDVTQTREQKRVANEQAFEGSFPPPNEKRINQRLERGAVVSGQNIDAQLVPDDRRETPLTMQVREQGLDKRFAQPRYRDLVASKMRELEKGQNNNTIADQDGVIVGRAQSVNPHWFKGRDDIGGVDDVRRAVDKALRGEKLGERQARSISLIMDVIDDESARYGGTSREEWDSLFDSAAFAKSIDPDDTASLDGWVPAPIGAYLFDEGTNAPLRTIAMLWEEALDRGISQADLEQIDNNTDTAEQLARAINDAIQQGNTETAIERNSGRSGENQTEASGDAEAILGSQDRIGREPELASRQEVVSTQRKANGPVGGESPTVRGAKIDEEWTAFADDSGTLKIPRAEMPQVKAEHRGALANFLKARGIAGTEDTVPARSLKPTQAEFSEAKVGKAKAFTGGDRAILVSADGHVVDGHHQWLAKHDNDKEVRVIRLEAPIREVLEKVKEFPSAEQDDSAASSEKTSDSPVPVVDNFAQELPGETQSNGNNSGDPSPDGIQVGGGDRGSGYGQSNTLFTADVAEKARVLLRSKLGQMNTGIDPEILQAGITLAGYHVEAGARAFADFTKAMIRDLGEGARPFLRSWYEGVRYYPGMNSEGMTPSSEIESIETGSVEGRADDEHSSTDTPEDRARVDAQQDAGSDIPDGGRGPSRPSADVSGEKAVTGQQRTGSAVGIGGPTTDGKRSNKPVRSEKSGLEGSASRDTDSGRSGPDSTGGLFAERERVKSAGDIAKSAPVRISRLSAGVSQAVNLGDTAEIKAQMPFLTDGQAEDVAFAERRFSKPDGYGVLFTNGTGTGKTFSGLGVVKRMSMSGKNNILVAVPKQTIADAWVKAGAKFFGLDISRLESTKDAGKGIVVTTYANLGDNNEVMNRDWDAIVADESHYLSSDQKGSNTGALRTMRAMTLKRGTARDRVDAKNPDKATKMRELYAAAKQYRESGDERYLEMERKATKQADAISRELAELAKAEQARMDTVALADRPRAVFLSATPFAYEKSVKWANEFLFDWGSDQSGSVYNSGDNYEQFMMTHFGYRMRYNKLTEPDAKIDRGLMQRSFNAWLQKEGVLSGRALDSDYDYDRLFVFAESRIGRRVDDAIEWMRERSSGDDEVPGMSDLYKEIVGNNFDYHARMYFLEAIKAREAIPVIKGHLGLGRKVLVMHDFKKGGAVNPFRVSPNDETRDAYNLFKAEFKDLINAFSSLPSPIETVKAEFPDALVYNGDFTAKQRLKMQDQFNDDAAHAPRVMVAQGDAMREGVSIHDTTGKHPRVLVHLGMPVKPTAAIQQEGRIYRTGQASDAMFRYLTIGSSWERYAFASKIAGRASAAENLAMGEAARGLKDAFITAYENADTYQPGFDGEGKGGRETDGAYASSLTPWDMAKSFYFGTKKQGSGRGARGREHSEFFATPEPLGLKMVQWADIRGGESVLEPSAGHGAIARWFPENTENRAIEYTNELSSKLALHFDGDLMTGDFMEHHVVNKYDAIVMNPPFGKGGKQAAEHVEKAMKHLRDGGRIVALIPVGPAADKRFDALLESDSAKDIYTAAEIQLPGVTFERAGTSVRTRVLVLEKQTNEELAQRIQQSNRDYSDADSIEAFFDRLEDSEIGSRVKVVEGVDSAPSPEGESTVVAGEFDTWEASHTQTGEQLFMAKPSGKLDKPAFAAVRSIAKAHGGYWSRFGKAGFLFKSEESRLAFTREASGHSEIPAFSRRLARGQRGKKALSKSALELTVSQFLKEFKGADDVTVEVVGTAAELPGYDAERDAGSIIEAQYHDKSDTLYLNAGAGYSSIAAAQAAIREELLVHKGLGLFSPAGRQHIYAKIKEAAEQSEQVASLWSKIERDYGDIADQFGMDGEQRNRYFAEELLGEIAQQKITPLTKGFNKLFLAIKRWLTDLGWINKTIGHRELLEVVYQIGDAFRDGRRAVNRNMSADWMSKDVPAFNRREAASSLLKPGGKLVAIMSGTPGQRQNTTNREFSEWVDKHDVMREPLPEGSFKSSFRPTGVGTQMVVIEKPPIAHSRTAKRVSAKPKGVGLGAARIAIAKFLKQYQGADDVTIKVFRTYEEAHGKPAPFRTKGGYDPESDTLFIYTGSLDSIADLNEALRHEILVHKGLGMVEPFKLKQLLSSLREAAKDSRVLKGILDDVERVEAGRTDALKAEEMLARIAEDRLSLPDKIWNRIVLALQRVLAPLGLWRVDAYRQARDVVYRIGDAFAEGKQARRRDTDAMFNQSVYHGSPYEFDMFSLDAVGGGEGAQAYGWGLYFAGKRAVAEYYRDLSGAGSIYQADIPEDSELLDYDLSLDKQPPRVRAALEGLPAEVAEQIEFLDGVTSQKTDGGGLYDLLKEHTGSAKKASELLDGLGIPGIRYSDAGSRIIGGKDGTYNYVIWDENRVTLEAVNDEMRQAQNMRFSRDNGPESPAWQRAKAKGLDMSKEARMKRARDMGYIANIEDVIAGEIKNGKIILATGERSEDDARNLGYNERGGRGGESRGVYPQTFYHGTVGDFDQFDTSHPGAQDEGFLGKGIYLSTTPGLANSYANIKSGRAEPNVMPLMVRGSRFLRADLEFKRSMQGAAFKDKAYIEKVTAAIQAQGYDGIILEFNDTAELVVFDPVNIRSVNAAFDPDEAGSSNILYSRSAQKSNQANIRRGKNSLAKALTEKTSVHRAMFRNGLGWIDFVWGDEGRKPSPSGKRRGAKGLSHIIEARQRKDGMTEREAISFVGRLVETIANGEEISRTEIGGSTRVGIDDGSNIAWLVKNAGSNGWLVTGYEKNPDGGRGGRAPTAPTHKAASLTRGSVGAGESIVDQDDVSGQILHSRTAEISPEREAVLSKIGMAPDRRSSFQKVKDALRDWWREVSESFIPAVADKFHDLKKINAEAYMRARMSTNTGAALAAALGHATPEWHEDGILQAKRGSTGLLDILKPIEGEVNEWVGWMVGKRAERLAAEDRENLLTESDIAELLDVSPEQAARFQKVADEWREYNGAMLDLMAGGGLITQESADHFKQDPYYIPFYREIVDETGEIDVAAPFTKRGLSHQKDGIEALKGGASNLQDPLKNMLMNVTRAIDASVKNNALRRIVDEVDVGAEGAVLSVAYEGNRSGSNVIRVRRDGENEYYRVHDLGVLGALSAMNDMQRNTLTRALGIPKRLLTAGVTATPTFMLRNAIRDITASWMQSEDVKWQADKAMGQFSDALKLDDDTIDMMMAGSAFMGGYRYSNDATSNAQALREQLRAKGMGTAEIDGYMSSLFDGSKRAWEWYREKGERFENMSRLKLFKDARESGLSYVDAAYRAKDLMDFSLHGRAQIMHFLIQTVPFMNARIQGLYKLGRVGANQKNMAELSQMVAFKGAMLAAATLALYALNEDDDDYQALPDWDKDANWHIFLDGEHLRIPKPFELGLFFSTIPERAARLANGDDDARAFFKSIGTNLIETLSMNPVPQALMPATEAALNYDVFRGRAIDNQSDMGSLPGSRQSLYTSELAKGIGALLEEAGYTGDMASPKRIDHLIKGYTGSMGISLLSATDSVLQILQGRTLPELNQRDYPVVGWFARGDDPGQTRYGDEFYRLMERANQAYRTLNDPELDDSRRERVLEDYHAELKGRSMLNTTSRKLSKLRKQREAIFRDDELSASEKRVRLNSIQALMNELQRRSVERLESVQ